MPADDIEGIRSIYGSGIGLVNPLVKSFLFVDNSADENDGNYSIGDLSLREAIALADSDLESTIVFDSAMRGETISLFDELVISKDINILGLGADLITIKANDPTPSVKNGDGDRLIRISPLSPRILQVSLSGLTLTGGDASESGGAILAEATNLTITESLLTNNATLQSGGAIAMVGGELSITTSELTENSAGDSGGAIATRDADSLSFNWELLYGPQGITLPASTAQNYEFIPTIEGLYHFQLTATDNYGGSDVAEFELNVAPVNGNEFLVAEPDVPTGGQIPNSIAVDGAGNYILAWLEAADFGVAGNAYAQRFDAAGNRIGPRIQVNSVPRYDGGIYVAANAAGDFVIAYDIRSDQFGYETDVFFRRFDNQGNPLGGEVIVANSIGTQIGSTVGIADDGRIVVTWEDRTTGGIWYRGFLYDNSEWLPATRGETSNTGAYPRVDMQTDGAFALGWWYDDGNGWDVFARRFDSAGTPRENEFQINDNATPGNHFLNGLELLRDGSVLAGWSIPGYDGDGSRRGVMQRFDSTPIGSPILVSETSLGEQTAPWLALDGEENIVATWASPQDVDGTIGVYARRFNAAGVPLGGEFRVHTTQAGLQSYTTQPLAVRDNGDFIAYWFDYGDDVFSQYRGRAQLFALNPSLVDSSHASISSAISGPTTVRPLTLTTLLSEVTGLPNVSTTTTIINSLIADNTAEVRGGAIDNLGSVLTIHGSTLSGNAAVGGTEATGGAIASTGAVISSFTTITNNSSTGSAGGIYTADGVSLSHMIVAGNSAVSDSADISGLTTASFSLVGDSQGTGLAETPLGMADIDGNFVGGAVQGPIDPLLGPLADNGGRTRTHALLTGSLALNSGDPSIAFDPNEFDQRGSGFVRVSLGRINMGAIENEPIPIQGLVVSSLSDGMDGDTSIGQLSLREAIEIANSTLGPDTITFDTDLLANPHTILLSEGELDIKDELSIIGLGTTNTTIDAQHLSRIFNIKAASGNFLIDRLSVTRGMTTGEDELGGAIRARGLINLTIRESVVSGSQTTGDYSFGGGIYSQGILSLENCLVTGNSTSGESAYGGGVAAGRELILLNTTISHNSTLGEFSGGAGIFSFFEVSVFSSTIVNNLAVHATSEGGGIRDFLGPIWIANSIVAGNQSGSGNSDLSLGAANIPEDYSLDISHSLIGDTGGLTAEQLAHLLNATGNLLNIDPQLGPLAENGGPTWTHALLPSSPAIDMGDPNFVGPPNFDQRGVGFDRVQGGRIDMGAFEVQAENGSADFDNDSDVDGRDFLAWQRGGSPDAFSGDDLALWQGEYGTGGLSAISSQLSAGEGREQESRMVPWAVSLLSGTRAGGPCYVMSNNDYMEVLAVDRALEELGASTRLGKPAVAPFGEMVARRGVKGLRN